MRTIVDHFTQHHAYSAIRTDSDTCVGTFLLENVSGTVVQQCVRASHGSSWKNGCQDTVTCTGALTPKTTGAHAQIGLATTFHHCAHVISRSGHSQTDQEELAEFLVARVCTACGCYTCYLRTARTYHVPNFLVVCSWLKMIDVLC